MEARDFGFRSVERVTAETFGFSTRVGQIACGELDRALSRRGALGHPRARDHAGAAGRRERDVAPRHALGPAPGAGLSTRRRRISASATRISISANAAPRQRRTPPPNGIHA